MNIEQQMGQQPLPSELNDPFSKTKITRIYVSYGTFFNKWSANGTIEFENGDTNGEQKFKGETFDEVVIKMKAFIQNLK